MIAKGTSIYTTKKLRQSHPQGKGFKHRRVVPRRLSILAKQPYAHSPTNVRPKSVRFPCQPVTAIFFLLLDTKKATTPGSLLSEEKKQTPVLDDRDDAYEEAEQTPVLDDRDDDYEEEEAEEAPLYVNSVTAETLPHHRCVASVVSLDEE